MLKLWLQTHREDPTPLFATHQVGVSGFVLNEESNEVLVVQDKNRPYTLWKFPGGLSNLGEDIGDTAVREVFEETGIKCEFKSILSFRQQHQHPGAFGRSDFYVICRLKPLTLSINACSDEIRQCKWMHISDIKQEVESSSLTKRLADMMEFGLANGFDKIDIHCEEMKSVYKGLKFKLYHRPFSLQKSTD
ncbi:hypothetical protein SNE40_016860 [Patella caerulea]|uniref:Nucleoside diphosphate-linked moiety X motif 6 n=1 Tax=Patella caerulea TaxID=87958 RepID=A0AAN8J9B0_PATCE